MAETFLANAPIVDVSAVTGQGLPDLVTVLDNLVKEVPEREIGSFFVSPSIVFSS
jgi:selenocysteine-specific elongation factor